MLHRIEKKIIYIRDILNFLYELKDDCDNKFLSDRLYQSALLHNLYLVADNSISLAEMVLKYKNIPKRESYFESIDMLGECGILPAQFAYDFAKIASFRNFLAHHYEKIDYKEICEKTLEKLEDIEKYLRYLEVKLEL